MPPEVLDRRPIDARADLYSLGVVLHQAALGELPFVGRDADVVRAQRKAEFEPLGRRRPDLPEAFGRLIRVLLDPNPERRPADARDARQRLLDALEADERAPWQVLSAAFTGRGHELSQLTETVCSMPLNSPLTGMPV